MYARKIIQRCFLSVLLINLSFITLAQTVNDKSIILEKKAISESIIRLEKITNNSGYDVEIIITDKSKGRSSFEISKGENRTFDIECRRIQANPMGAGAANGGGGIIWNEKKTAAVWAKMQENKRATEPQIADKRPVSEPQKKSNSQPVELDRPIKARVKKIDSENLVSAFLENISNDDFWSISAIEELEREIDRHIASIENWNNKDQYISDNNITEYVKVEGKKLYDHKAAIDKTINNFLSSYEGYIIEGNDDYKNRIKRALDERLSRRETSLERLNDAINSVEKGGFDITSLDGHTLINICAIAFALGVLIIWLSVSSKKKKSKMKTIDVQRLATNEASPAIVVRRKTTSILKKQSLEDVINNKAYYKIECEDFCNDSAVRRIYIKNTCVKDIYNMYADDLRNPNNPKEDGCMVLGRWVYDDHSNEYYVSLEEIVRPGDDAVFQEYELNFGGKIKLRVAEKLRKLRRDTNLQYDLTCWVHSHPGLGVFFSNSDSNVQMQLKHPSHPNFLTAIVVDILTPQQEMGIFTFKHNSAINSRNDLKKLYSLEELHKWAVESDRNSFKADDYYNTLANATDTTGGCQKVMLSNGAIIDISSIITEGNTGLSGWICGFSANAKDGGELVINTVAKSKDINDNEILGCLIIGTHCSIPSIRKAIANNASEIKFVMFYSLKDETITTIPMIDQQLAMDEKYYSEEKLENLKIWTRRKR